LPKKVKKLKLHHTAGFDKKTDELFNNRKKGKLYNALA
jgi:hypothetical protein